MVLPSQTGTSPIDYNENDHRGSPWEGAPMEARKPSKQRNVWELSSPVQGSRLRKPGKSERWDPFRDSTARSKTLRGLNEEDH